MKIKVYVEHLYHFNCGSCKRWWTHADIKPFIGSLVYCPHCGTENEIKEFEIGEEVFNNLLGEKDSLEDDVYENAYKILQLILLEKIEPPKIIRSHFDKTRLSFYWEKNNKKFQVSFCSAIIQPTPIKWIYTDGEKESITFIINKPEIPKSILRYFKVNN